MKRAPGLLLFTSLALAACGRDAANPLAPQPGVVADVVTTPTTAPVMGASLSGVLTEPPILLLTDKSDYLPGETVHVTGHGWKPGVEIQLLLEVDPATRDPVSATVVPDANGDFAWADYVTQEADRGVLFRLTATGDGHGGMAYFTDPRPDPPPPPPAQTTLSATKTAAGHWERTFKWTIDKSASPDEWNLFKGDAGTSNYVVAVIKDAGTDAYYVSGQVCVTNGGSYATENLSIVDEVQYKAGSGQFQELTHQTVELGTNTVLAAGETHCYPYQVVFEPVAGAQYRNVAHVTITNHAGWMPGDNSCPGPSACPFGPDPKTDFSLPGTPDVLINNSIHVDDTNGGSWAFSASGIATYAKTFSCDDDEGENDNTATIRETGQSDGASVTVNCYALSVTKDAATAFKRTYDWTVDKSADQSALTLAVGQSFLVNYSVLVSATYTDSDWGVSGTITVHNPAPMAATLHSVSDAVSDVGAATVSCGVTFPHSLAAGSDLACTYEAALPNASTRANTATATLLNTPSGTTDFTGTASVDFSGATRTDVDESVDLSDTYAGALGQVGYAQAPKTFTYSRTLGPYTTCGSYTVENTASFTTSDLGVTGSDGWTVNVNVPCGGCTLTIGYWKTHAGFGPQRDMVTPLLPIWLGTPLGVKSVQVTTAAQAVLILSFNNDASNGINKLMGQLLGAKLDIADGADGSAIASTIAAADAFLATKNSADWNTLTRVQKNQVLAWMTTLDNYNNGLTGPGHCSQ